jgi:hypothetical protein
VSFPYCSLITLRLWHSKVLKVMIVLHNGLLQIYLTVTLRW